MYDIIYLHATNTCKTRIQTRRALSLHNTVTRCHVISHDNGHNGTSTYFIPATYFLPATYHRIVKTIHAILLGYTYVMHINDRLTRIGTEEKDKIQIDSVNNSLTVVEEGDMANDRLVGRH